MRQYPTSIPTPTPTALPTTTPTPYPTSLPTSSPTALPTSTPTPWPTAAPSPSPVSRIARSRSRTPLTTHRNTAMQLTSVRVCVSVFATRGRLGGQTLAPTPYPTPKPSPEPPVFVSLNLTFVVRNVDTDAQTFNADYRSQGVIRVRHTQPLR